MRYIIRVETTSTDQEVMNCGRVILLDAPTRKYLVRANLDPILLNLE